MPTGDVAQAINPMVEAYQQAYERITSQLVGVANDPDQWRKTARLREVRASVDRELTYLDQEIAPQAAQATYWSNELGFARGAVGAGAQAVQWDLIDRGAVEVLAKGLYEDLLQATSLVDQTSKKLLRRLGRDASLTKMLEGQTAVQAGRSMARQAKDLGVFAVTYSNGSRHGLDEYAAMSMRTVTANAYNGALVEGAVAEGCKFFEIFDGPDCGLTFHEDPQIADGLVVDDETARAYPISHPNCRRSFGPRPDVTNEKEAGEAERSTTEGQRADQISTDLSRGLPVRPEAVEEAWKQSRTPVQKASKATKPHRTPKAAKAEPPAPKPYRRFDAKQGQDMQDYGVKNWEEWRKSLGREQRKDIEDYTGWGYKDLNRNMRLGEPLSRNQQRLRESIGESLEQTMLPENLTLHRGVNPDWAEFVERFDRGGWNPGDTIKDGGFMSTSLNPDTAQEFLYGGVSWEIRAPAGTKGGYVGEMSRYGHEEYEVLLSPGTTLRVVETSVDPKGGARHMVLEVAGQD